MRTWFLMSCMAALVALAGCGDDDSGVATGSEGGPCYPNDTCDGDLVCLSGYCVAAPPCSVGGTRPCECLPGETGVQTCLADETWGDCDCDPAECGNDVAEGDEVCDGTDLDGATCVGEGFGGGVLACDGGCALDTSGCDPCGNGALDGAEHCDGAELDGQDCASQGFVSGTLACGSDCTFDTTGCESCGNDVLDAGELCDGPALGGEDCMSQGFAGGTLACDFGCVFDVSGCTTCTETSAGILEVPLDMIVILDRSGSMSGASWTSSVAALSSFFSDPSSAAITAGLNFFPPSVCADQCDPACYNPPQVGLGLLATHATTLVNAMNSETPGGVTPTSGALMGTLQYATSYKDLNPDHAVVVVMASDGDPTACDTNIASIAALAASAYNYNGVQTYTVAIQGATVASLGQIAAAGGGQMFDVTADITLFTQAMEDIRTSVGACDYPIPSSVSDPMLLNVDFVPSSGPTQRLGQADNLADCGAAAGWYLDDPVTPQRILLCPATCAALDLDAGSLVEVTEGCPSVQN